MTDFKARYGPAIRTEANGLAAGKIAPCVEDLALQATKRMECYIADLAFTSVVVLGTRWILRIEKIRQEKKDFCDPFWWV